MDIITKEVCYVVTDHNGHRMDQSRPFHYADRATCQDVLQEMTGQYPPKDFYHFIADYKELR